VSSSGKMWDPRGVGHCARCPDCPSGEYSKGCRGSLSGTCADCPKGYFATTVRDVMEGTGKWVPKIVAAYCLLCPLGKHSHKPGVIMCESNDGGVPSVSQRTTKEILMVPLGKFFYVFLGQHFCHTICHAPR
jgi:hypothetical protein